MLEVRRSQCGAGVEQKKVSSNEVSEVKGEAGGGGEYQTAEGLTGHWEDFDFYSEKH